MAAQENNILINRKDVIHNLQYMIEHRKLLPLERTTLALAISYIKELELMNGCENTSTKQATLEQH